jgi:hypothetical protein
VCVQLDGKQFLRDSSECSTLVMRQGQAAPRIFLLNVSTVCDGILSNSGIAAVAGPGELMPITAVQRQLRSQLYSITTLGPRFEMWWYCSQETVLATMIFKSYACRFQVRTVLSSLLFVFHALPSL